MILNPCKKKEKRNKERKKKRKCPIFPCMEVSGNGEVKEADGLYCCASVGKHLQLKCGHIHTCIYKLLKGFIINYKTRTYNHNHFIRVQLASTGLDPH